MVNKKDRRNSGRKITKIYDPINEPLEEEYYDDWIESRDGMRNSKAGDRTLKHRCMSNYYRESNEKVNKKIFGQFRRRLEKKKVRLYKAGK
jgi:hypothetical protein